MVPKTIIKIDRYAGIPLCFLLTGFARIRNSIASIASDPHIPKKILFLKLTEQGASVLAHSAIKRAENIVGRGNVYFCVFRETKTW
jgi:hypothetical protein